MERWLIFLSLVPALALAQPPKMHTVLYGAAYYHEYMPYERLEKDVQLMQQAGLSVVRVGESTWTSWEPREGEFHFDWMERIIDRMQKAGIKVILGTPTYSIPPWLYRKHPEITVKYPNGQFGPLTPCLPLVLGADHPPDCVALQGQPGGDRLPD